MSPSQLKSYQQLIHPETHLFIQTHGEKGMFALGFQGPESEIQKWHTLFCNFDTRARDECGDFPKPPRLIFLGPSLAYINLSKERLRASLFLHFLTNIPLLGDVQTSYSFDEETETESFTRDELEIERLAREAAEHFVTHEFKTRCFIPHEQRPLFSEFSCALHNAMSEQDASTRFESLVDCAVGT